MSNSRKRIYKEMLFKQEQQAKCLEKLESTLQETNEKLEEMTSLLKAVVINYLLEDLDKTCE